MFPFHLVKPDLFCAIKKNKNVCENKMIGPIKFDPLEPRKEHPVFFMTNRAKLETERYEFHVSKHSPASKSLNSYVYMLFDIKDASL